MLQRISHCWWVLSKLKVSTIASHCWSLPKCLLDQIHNATRLETQLAPGTANVNQRLLIVPIMEFSLIGQPMEILCQNVGCCVGASQARSWSCSVLVQCVIGCMEVSWCCIVWALIYKTGLENQLWYFLHHRLCGRRDRKPGSWNRGPCVWWHLPSGILTAQQ